MMCDMHVLGAAPQIVDYKSEVVVTEGMQEEEKEEVTVKDSEKVELGRFGAYVAEMHANNNDGFEIQFQVNMLLILIATLQ